jgi:YHS domain-containing protein
VNLDEPRLALLVRRLCAAKEARPALPCDGMRLADARPEQEGTMEIDVVCGVEVDPTCAPTETAFEGRSFYFCSQHCLEQFESAPREFLMHRTEMLS